MPDVNVKGRYRIYTHDGTTPLSFTTYSNQLCSIRRPNPNTFITISTYIPGSLSPFTTFDPGSSYTIVTKSNTADFSMGPYTRVDRLPSSVTFRSPNFYHGLDKNSITVALSSYALSVNSPLSTAFTYVPNQDGYFVNSISFNTQRFKEGLPSLLTHLTPNSSYQFINRSPFTFFAPLQSEMGDAYATARNDGGEYGMGYRYNNNSLPGDNIYGIWDKIVFNNAVDECVDNNQTINASSIAALSSCGTTKALFVLGSNLYGQLGTSSTKQYYATWTRVPGQWLDVEMGQHHMLAINSAGHLYACGDNTNGQLGLGSGTARTNTLTLVDNNRSYVELAPRSDSTMVRDSNGFLYACGLNDTGQLGIGNTSSPIYTLTQEVLGYVWTSVKANPARGYFVAISNQSLYGRAASTSNSYYFGVNTNAPAVPYAFTREDLNLSDVQTVDVGRYGTFIRRQNQNNIFAVGDTSIRFINYLAALSGERILPYFTRINVPSNASVIIPTNSNNAFYYVQNNMLFRRTGGTTFANTNINTFNIFAGIVDSPTFILSARNDLRPTPTPTKTPAPTPTPSAVPYSDSGVEGFGMYYGGRSDGTYMYFTTALNYGYNLNSSGYSNFVNVPIGTVLPGCPGRNISWYPNVGAIYSNVRYDLERYYYNDRDFARCVFGWGKNNRVYCIAYTTNSVYNSQSNLYLFKPHITYSAGADGNYTINRPVVGCTGSNNNGVEIPVTNRGWIEVLVGERDYGSRRAQIDFQFSPYTQKCGILYWRTTRKYPSTSTSQEFIDLIYAESSTNNDLNTWTTGNTIDTDLYKLQNQTFVFFNTYNMIKPKLYYDKTDSPTTLYLKGSGTSNEILIYKNIITNETTSIASGNFYPSQAMLNIKQPDYQLIFNANNKPVIFFNSWPSPVIEGDVNSGTNTLRCYFNGTTSNVIPLSVVRYTSDLDVSDALMGWTFYDLYYESGDTIYIAYLDNWITFGTLKSMPRTVRVIQYNFRTGNIIDNSKETVYTIPPNYGGSTSYANNAYMVTGLKIFFDKRLQKIIVAFTIWNTAALSKGPRANGFYQRNGLNNWVNISPNTNNVRIGGAGCILKR
jgi:hypothetical protein